jgi:hypothetical protein
MEETPRLAGEGWGGEVHSIDEPQINNHQDTKRNEQMQDGHSFGPLDSW